MFEVKIEYLAKLKIFSDFERKLFLLIIKIRIISSKYATNIFKETIILVIAKIIVAERFHSPEHKKIRLK
jgi:hypothetical protein